MMKNYRHVAIVEEFWKVVQNIFTVECYFTFLE